MKVIRANVLGFCMGVRCAVSKTIKKAEDAGGLSVYTLGPLVHNPNVLEELKKLGVKTLKKDPAQVMPDLKGCTVIIRAHGINPECEQTLRGMGANIIDATCPKVKKSQLKARDLSRAGYSVFLAGEKNHAEIEGILGFVHGKGFCITVGNKEEAEKAAGNLKESAASSNVKSIKTALIGQTTISQEEYREIASAIKKYFPDLKVCDTICSATRDRQRALRELLGRVDAVIIAGGKESANTRRLYAIAEEYGKPCVLAENACDIPPEFFNYKTVGLSAGASTPDSIIDDIEKLLTNF